MAGTDKFGLSLTSALTLLVGLAAWWEGSNPFLWMIYGFVFWGIIVFAAIEEADRDKQKPSAPPTKQSGPQG